MSLMIPFHVLVAIAAVALAAAIAEVFLSGLIWGAGYSPSPHKTVVRMLDAAGVLEGTKVYDLGSGFGGVVFEAARRYGATCVGVEIDPLKCWWSRWAAKRKQLDGKVEIRRKNLFDVDVSDADVVFLFLYPPVMKKVKEKLLKQMKPGKVVVSRSYRLPGWEPEVADEKLGAYLYRVPPREGGF